MHNPTRPHRVKGESVPNWMPGPFSYFFHGVLVYLGRWVAHIGSNLGFQDQKSKVDQNIHETSQMGVLIITCIPPVHVSFFQSFGPQNEFPAPYGYMHASWVASTHRSPLWYEGREVRNCCAPHLGVDVRFLTEWQPKWFDTPGSPKYGKLVIF